MRTAKDGKPFDIDYLGELRPGEVEIIQFLRPDGKRRRMSAFLGEEFVKMAEDLILSAEDLGNGKVSIWARKTGQPEEQELIEIADNGPGKNSPDNCLKRLINRINGKGNG